MIHRFSILLSLLLAVLPVQASAQSESEEESEPTFMDLLEFLGEFEAENGEWVDPVEFIEQGNARRENPETDTVDNDDE